MIDHSLLAEGLRVINIFGSFFLAAEIVGFLPSYWRKIRPIHDSVVGPPFYWTWALWVLLAIYFTLSAVINLIRIQVSIPPTVLIYVSTPVIIGLCICARQFVIYFVKRCESPSTSQ